LETIVVVGPAAEPVTLEQLKRHARLPLDLDEEDGEVVAYGKAARRLVEKRTALRFVDQTLATTFEAFPCGSDPLRLPWAPVRSLVAVTYRDEAGAEATLDPAAYRLKGETPGEVRLVDVDARWPDGSEVRVEYVAGHGDGPDDVPEDARLAVCVLAAHWYQTRLPVATASAASVPLHVKDLVDGLRWGAYPR
jgi:uncharacterized phiE125 gp8 family phage protein